MINGIRSTECSGEHPRADKANNDSEKNRTIHSGVFYSELHPQIHGEKSDKTRY